MLFHQDEQVQTFLPENKLNFQIWGQFVEVIFVLSSSFSFFSSSDLSHKVILQEKGNLSVEAHFFASFKNVKARVDLFHEVIYTFIHVINHSVDCQMLTFTDKGIKPLHPAAPASLCPEIGCCWGVSGSHPWTFSTCSKNPPYTAPYRSLTHTHTPAYIQSKCPPDKEHNAQRWCSDRCSCHMFSISPPPKKSVSVSPQKLQEHTLHTSLHFHSTPQQISTALKPQSFIQYLSNLTKCYN